MSVALKGILSWSLCLVLLLTFAVFPVFAEESEQASFGGVSVTITGRDDGTDLLAAYARQQLESLRGTSSSDTKLYTKRRTPLEGMNAAVYAALKTRIVRVAAGELSSTRFSVTWAELGLEQTSWTAEELGVASCLTDDAKRAVFSKISFDLGKVIDALLADCPYELYWYDKTQSTGYDSISFSRTADEFRLTSPGYRISFPVASEYSAGDFEADTSPGIQITAALNNIRATIDRFAGSSDYNKLLGYRDTICELTDYNYAAAAGTVAYGNPWQLIWVFDGDPTTKVVCEGYAKAFQYLCDLTAFTDSRITAYSVTGRMDGAAHMWNIVAMDTGRNYLVDVTGCDSGQSGSLFLAGNTGGSVSAGYRIAVSYGTPLYEYDSDTLGIFSETELTLSQRDYRTDSGSSTDPTPDPPQDLFSDVTDPNTYYYDAVYWAKDNGITTGTSPTTFSPDAKCTRAQFVTFLWRAAGSPVPAGAGNPFRDVKTSDYFYSAVLWAYGRGITTGTSSTAFSPYKPCTRAQCVTFLWRAAGKPRPEGTAAFRDVTQNDSFYDAVQWAYGRGITTGTTAATFSPGADCSRSQSVTMLYRYYNGIG